MGPHGVLLWHQGIFLGIFFNPSFKSKIPSKTQRIQTLKTPEKTNTLKAKGMLKEIQSDEVLVLP